MNARFHVCFVCTGNICRSPTAAGLLAERGRAAGLDLHVDSCGISAEEQGNPADPRTVAEARRRGVLLPPHRARALTAADFAASNWLVGMTQAHVRALERRRPTTSRTEVHLLLDFTERYAGQDVPDPWYGDAQAFVRAFDLVALGVDGMVAALLARR